MKCVIGSLGKLGKIYQAGKRNWIGVRNFTFYKGLSKTCCPVYIIVLRAKNTMAIFCRKILTKFTHFLCVKKLLMFLDCVRFYAYSMSVWYYVPAQGFSRFPFVLQKPVTIHSPAESCNPSRIPSNQSAIQGDRDLYGAIKHLIFTMIWSFIGHFKQIRCSRAVL